MHTYGKFLSGSDAQRLGPGSHRGFPAGPAPTVHNSFPRQSPTPRPGTTSKIAHEVSEADFFAAGSKRLENAVSSGISL